MRWNLITIIYQPNEFLYLLTHSEGNYQRINRLCWVGYWYTTPKTNTNMPFDNVDDCINLIFFFFVFFCRRKTTWKYQKINRHRNVFVIYLLSRLRNIKIRKWFALVIYKVRARGVFNNHFLFFHDHLKYINPTWLNPIKY